MKALGTNTRRVKPTTQKEVARAAGVSQMSVALVLGHSANHPDAKKRVGEATRQRIIREATRLGYRPIRQAQILRGARSGMIGMLKNLSNHEVNVKMVQEAGLKIHDSGYKLLTAEIVSTRNEMENNLHAMLDERVEGLLIQGSIASIVKSNPKLLTPIQQAGIPIVVLGGPRSTLASSFAPDYVQGMHDLVRHFLEQDCKSLAYLSFLNNAADPKQNPEQWIDHTCLKGFRMAAKAFHLSSHLIDEFHFPNTCGQSDLELGYAAGQKLVNEKKMPRGLLCRNDLMATGLIAALYHAGVAVPEEVRVAGFDNTAVGRFAPIPLTTVQYPVVDMARAAVEQLQGLIQGTTQKHVHRLFPCTVVPRISTDFKQTIDGA